MKALVSFDSSHAAMEAELLGEEAGISCRLVPLPPAISAGCGLVLLTDTVHIIKMTALLNQRHVPWEGIYVEQSGRWMRREKP